MGGSACVQCLEYEAVEDQVYTGGTLNSGQNGGQGTLVACFVDLFSLVKYTSKLMLPFLVCLGKAQELKYRNFVVLAQW
jgi:hypothetical protein